MENQQGVSHQLSAKSPSGAAVRECHGGNRRAPRGASLAALLWASSLQPGGRGGALNRASWRGVAWILVRYFNDCSGLNSAPQNSYTDSRDVTSFGTRVFAGETSRGPQDEVTLDRGWVLNPMTGVVGRGRT